MREQMSVAQNSVCTYKPQTGCMDFDLGFWDDISCVWVLSCLL